MKKSPVCVLVCAMISLASAFNHPEIQWKSVTTAHFIINYYDRTEPAVYATWKIAEAAYESLSSLYEYEERAKINISLADYDDISNGFTLPSNGSILIYIMDGRFDFRGNNTWLNNVITHELSHAMTLEKRSKMQLFDWAFSFGYESPDATMTLAEPFATARFFPEWLAEGIAQRESERRGNDCWDSKRDMLLKDAVVGGRALSLDEMGHFNHNSLGNEMVYNQGFSFVKYIEEKIGTSNLTRVFNSSRNTALVSDGFYGMFENQTGQSLDGLYRLWLDSLRTSYSKRMPQNPTKTTMVWNKGFLNAMPKISRDGKWWGWLTNSGDESSRTDLVIAPYGSSAPSITLEWALSSWDFSADSKRVFFIKSHETSNNGSFFNDLYAADLATHRQRRLTRGARLYDVAACPDNQKIACVQFAEGAFSIITAGTDGCCRQTVAQGEIGRPFAGLSFSPVKTTILPHPAPAKADSSAAGTKAVEDTAPASAATPSAPEYMLASTRCINGKGTLCVVGIGSKTVTMIGTGTAQEEYPHWSKDGRIYFDADYDGTSNIYSVDPDGSGLSRHTDAQFGMLYPFTDDNRNLLCVLYAHQAFSIVSCGLTRGSPYAVPKQYACAFTDLPRPKGEVTIKSRPYEAKLLRPVWELQSALDVVDENGTFSRDVSNNRFNSWIDSTQLTIATGIVMGKSDALEKKSVSMGVMAAVFHGGISRDTANSSTSGSYLSGSSQAKMKECTLLLPGEKRQTIADRCALSLLREEPLIRKFSPGAAKTAATTATDTAGDSSATQSQWMPVFYPSFSYLNNEHTVSFGLNANVALVYFIPYIFQVQGVATWQIARDFYAGCFPGIELIPLAGFAIPDASLPLAFAYSTYDYLNTDINYNSSGLTQVQVLVQPETFLYGNLSDSAAGSLSSMPRASALTVALTAMHGFPLTTHSSIVLETEETYTGLSQPLSKPSGLLPRYLKNYLPGNSKEYLSGDIGASFVFPLWRQINGGPCYTDALYGTVGYDLTIVTNTTTFENDVSQAFVKPSFDKEHVIVSHVFSAGARLGFFKSFLFTRTLAAKAYWDVWKQKFTMNLMLGM